MSEHFVPKLPEVLDIGVGSDGTIFETYGNSYGTVVVPVSETGNYGIDSILDIVKLSAAEATDIRRGIEE